jgi:hypothetical protein
MEKNLIFGSAIHMAGEGTIAGIRRMQESSVQVSSAHTPGQSYIKKD